MGILDDTAIFAAVIQQGGFSHAARHLGLSNGLISRRISQLEANLGVTLLKRTTRQIQLTPEGELFWQHALRIQQELDAAVSQIQSSASKPKGRIRLSAPPYFGRHFLLPVIVNFMKNYPDIAIDLNLANDQVDTIGGGFDLAIRGSGFVDTATLRDSSLQMKMLIQEKIGLYASPEYLSHHEKLASVADLAHHSVIGFAKNEKWKFTYYGEDGIISINAGLVCNDIDGCLAACSQGIGVGKFTDLNVRQSLHSNLLKSVLTDYDWGSYHIYVVFPLQKALPKRTRLFLDFIVAHTQNMVVKVG